MNIVIQIKDDQIPFLCKLLGVTRYTTDLQTGQILIDWHPEVKPEDEHVHPHPQNTVITPKREKVCPLCGETFIPKKSMKQKYCDACKSTTDARHVLRRSVEVQPTSNPLLDDDKPLKDILSPSCDIAFGDRDHSDGKSDWYKKPKTIIEPIPPAVKDLPRRIL